ncbi:hypothetical protein [Kribbella sp. C-35]|uniref:hypothetical protein n=1 Tax=Kribbella sp. C-35 TaxID=2789276 RepID=UPI0039793DFD
MADEPLLTPDDAREIIGDLQRIVTPDGIQETFQLRAAVAGVRPRRDRDHW